jgi:hypothetical protein
MLRSRRRLGWGILLLGAGALWLTRPAPAQDEEPAKVETDIALAFDTKGMKNFKPTMQVGIVVTKGGAKKLLTYFPQQATGNTCIKLDGAELLLGQEEGKWMPMQAPLGNGRIGARSVWVYPKKIRITQTAEVIKGPQNGRFDTCRVSYLIENKDEEEHTVGIRYLLDTFVGSNDGAPVAVPGQKLLCETQLDLKGPGKVPPFAQLLEKVDFTAPGLVAHLCLKPGGGLEAPSRVSFGAWPGSPKVPGAQGPLTKWNVPVFSMREINPGPDGAAAIYWDPKTLAPGGKREVGFTYGLGNFSKNKAGTLAVILGGTFQAGEPLTVLALVKDPQEDQTLTLKVKGAAIAKGAATQKVPMPGADAKVGLVSWTLEPSKVGVALLDLEASTGERHRMGARISGKAGKKTEDE